MACSSESDSGEIKIVLSDGGISFDIATEERLFLAFRNDLEGVAVMS